MEKKKDDYRGMDKSRMLEASLEIGKVLDKHYDFKNADSNDFSEVMILLSRMVHVMATQTVFSCGASEIPDGDAAEIIYKVIQTTGDAVKDISLESLKQCVRDVKMKSAFGDAFGFGMGSQDLN